jgi:hypothetical protein
MRKIFLLISIAVLPMNILVAEGVFEPDRKENNAALEEIMNIFDENYQFLVFETIEEEYDEDGENGIYELHINNDYIFAGDFMLWCGGETNRSFDFKNYNFMMRVPRDVFMNVYEETKISKQTLMELLTYQYYMAEVTELDIDNLDIDEFFYILEEQGDISDFLSKNKNCIKNYTNNSIAGKTLKEGNRNVVASLLGFMMMLNGRLF